MQESFLHYLWQLQYFDKRELLTTSGSPVEVLHPGLLNVHAGPDFSGAKIMIDGIRWVGNVEIHVQSSGWIEHLHHRDQAYENVILHVVWVDNKLVCRSDGSPLPTLELYARVSPLLVEKYKKLVTNPSPIPCNKSFPVVDHLIKLSAFENAEFQRLESKAGQVLDALKRNQGDWRETTYQVVARNFGFNINQAPFEQLARSLPYKILAKHRDKMIQLEALLFGHSGFLEIPEGDDYYQELRQEYQLLNHKYGLSAGRLKKSHWRFLRLRPANFPTLRLGQFAALMAGRTTIFTRLFEIESYRSLRSLFTVTPSSYWQSHYRFNKVSKQPVAGMGDSSIDNLLVNAVVPLLVAYGKSLDRQELVDHAVDILQHLPAESNTVTRTWKALGYPAKTAFDAQAMMELYTHFCQRRNCLNCAIGASLLKPNLQS